MCCKDLQRTYSKSVRSQRDILLRVEHKVGFARVVKHSLPNTSTSKKKRVHKEWLSTHSVFPQYKIEAKDPHHVDTLTETSDPIRTC